MKEETTERARVSVPLSARAAKAAGRLGGLIFWWARLLIRAGVNFFQDDGFDRSAVISYYTLFSFLPFLGLVGLVGRWFYGSPDRALEEVLFGIEMILPTGGAETAARARAELANRGTVLLILTPLMLWTASYAATAVERAINHIFRSREHRHFWIAKLWSIALLGVGATALLLIPAIQQVGVVARGVSPAASVPGVMLPGKSLFSEAAILLGSFVTFAFTLIYIPAARVPRREALIVAFLASTVWQLARVVVARTLATAVGPGVLSGSFSFLIAVLIWVYTTATILLFAAEVLALAAGKR